MAKYIIGGIVVILLLALGTYYGFFRNRMPAPVQEQQQQVQQPTVSTYATSTWSITYPNTFTANENYAYRGVPNKPIAGVSFTIPVTMATGTNLADDTYLSVEQLPHAKNCTGDIFLYENVTPTTMTIGSTTWSVATTTENSAGSSVEEDVFAAAGSQPCTAVRYSIHSTDIANYPSGIVQAFDYNALVNTFDGIRDSLQLAPATR